MKKQLFFFCFVLFCFVEFVSGAAGGESSYRFLFSQVFNFLIFLGLIWFILKKVGRPWLKKEADRFLKLSEEAKYMEKKYEDDCTRVEKEIRKLEDKMSRVGQLVEETCRSLRKELEEAESRYREVERGKIKREVWRLKHNVSESLKNELLNQVLERTKSNIDPNRETLNSFVLLPKN